MLWFSWKICMTYILLLFGDLLVSMWRKIQTLTETVLVVVKTSKTSFSFVLFHFYRSKWYFKSYCFTFLYSERKLIQQKGSGVCLLVFSLFKVIFPDYFSLFNNRLKDPNTSNTVSNRMSRNGSPCIRERQ